jgi:RNA polymerase sigma-70 factor (ECF subfamily)
VLDAFCAAFNARDLARLTALLLDDATLEYPGLHTEQGAAAIRARSLHGTLFGCAAGGVTLDATPHCEVRAHRGEWIFLWWSGDEVHSIVRVTVVDDRIVRLVNHYHAPELLTEVCGELAVPFRTHGRQPRNL